MRIRSRHNELRLCVGPQMWSRTDMPSAVRPLNQAHILILGQAHLLIISIMRVRVVHVLGSRPIHYLRYHRKVHVRISDRSHQALKK